MKKLPVLFSAAVLMFAGLVFAPVRASAQAKEELVKIDKVEVEVQKTPKFQVEGPKEKHLPKARDWLEIEAECKAVYSKKAQDKKQLTYPEVTFQYFVYVEGQTKDKSRILTGEVIHINVPINEKAHSVMYVHPDTILNMTGKQDADKNAVKAWGVLAKIGGDTVGYKVSAGAGGSADKPWWENAGMPVKEPGLKNKSETPFAPLWGDYHLGIKSK